MGGCPQGKDICCVSCSKNNCESKCEETDNVLSCGFAKEIIEEGQTEVQIFENRYLQVFKQVADVTKAKKDLEDQEKKVKEQLEKAMNEYGIDSIDNQYLKITRVKASSSESVDLKKMEEKEPQLYAELLADYKKVTNKKAYLMFKVK
jgi:uncharacterized protein YpuA (DUF1002 family)